jgi:hypothetical protein
MHRASEKIKAITKIISDVWFTWMTIERWQIKYTNIRKVTLTFIDFKMQNYFYYYSMVHGLYKNIYLYNSYKIISIKTAQLAYSWNTTILSQKNITWCQYIFNNIYTNTNKIIGFICRNLNSMWQVLA